MSLHRCIDRGCAFWGQASTRGCGCYQTDEQVMHAALVKAKVLIEKIEQTPANVWFVNDGDPEVLVDDTYSAVLAAVGETL